MNGGGITFTSRCFKLTLVDIEYFDELRDYLKHYRGFQYGLAVYTLDDREHKVIYLYIKYARKRVIDSQHLHGCRVMLYKNFANRSIELYKNIGDVIWEEGQVDYKPKLYRQQTLDPFIVSKQFSLTFN